MSIINMQTRDPDAHFVLLFLRPQEILMMPSPNKYTLRHPIVYTSIMHLKIHKISGCDTIVAACDANLIGQTLTCPQCDIVVDEAFYGSESATEEEIIHALKSAANANIIGEKVCSIALKAGIIDKDTIILIGNIPHAQIYGV